MTTTSAPPNHDAMMLLEAPLARVPHDELRRHLRTQQRFVERDLTFCSTTLESITNKARSASASGSGSGSHVTITTIASPSRFSAQQHSVGQGNGAIGRETAEDQGDASAVDESLTVDMSFTSDARGDESMLGAMASREDSLMGGSSVPEEDSSLNSKSGSSELERSLDLMIGRVQGLKRKLTSIHDSTGSTLTRLEARTSHLDELHHIQSTASPAFDEWCRTRLDRMLVDWMLRKGFSQSAEMLARNRHIDNLADLSLFADISRIEASLLGSGGDPVPQQSDATAQPSPRSCGPTLAWCSENKAALRKIRSTLEFDLRLQEFIELTRRRTAQSLQDAILYSRRYLLPYLTSTAPVQSKSAADTTTDRAKTVGTEEKAEKEQQDLIRKQVARVMGLLACSPSGWAYGDLYNVERWRSLQVKFRAAALQIHSLPPQPLLHIALSAGLSSLKLPACYADELSSRATVPPSHLGGRAFGDERSNLLAVAGVTATTSVTAPPIFPPAAGFLQDSSVGSVPPPAVVLSPPDPIAASTDAADVERRAACALLKNDNCPVCDVHGLGTLAREVPWSHHANSTLVCSISGRMMDENDPPMALPNGRVYSLTALQEMASNSSDGMTVSCPRTGSSFLFSAVRKVYIS